MAQNKRNALPPPGGIWLCLTKRKVLLLLLLYYSYPEAVQGTTHTHKRQKTTERWAFKGPFEEGQLPGRLESVHEVEAKKETKRNERARRI